MSYLAFGSPCSRVAGDRVLRSMYGLKPDKPQISVDR
jgi:hypothetical protein